MTNETPKPDSPPALAPCPFCGATESRGDLPYNPIVMGCIHDCRWFVRCVVCDFDGPLADTPDGAASAWNRRAAPALLAENARLREEVAELRAALDIARLHQPGYARHCDYDAIPGLAPDASRPAERWFLGIKRGDTPATNEFARLALEWCDDFLARMRAAIPSLSATTTPDPEARDGDD